MASSRGTLVLVEPDAPVRDALCTLLQEEGWRVECRDDQADLDQILDTEDVAAVVSEALVPGLRPETLLELCKARKVPVIFTGHDTTVQGAVDLVMLGATDFLEKPFPQTRLVDLLNRMTSGQNSQA